MILREVGAGAIWTAVPRPCAALAVFLIGRGFDFPVLQGPFINTAGLPTTERALGRRARGWPMGLHHPQSWVVKPGGGRTGL